MTSFRRRSRHCAYCAVGVPGKKKALMTERLSQVCSAMPRHRLAERTGLEPATSGVTGRHSNQLNYRSVNIGRHLDIPPGDDIIEF